MRGELDGGRCVFQIVGNAEHGGNSFFVAEPDDVVNSAASCRMEIPGLRICQRERCNEAQKRIKAFSGSSRDRAGMTRTALFLKRCDCAAIYRR